MRLQEHFIRALNSRFRRYEKKLKDARRHFSEDTVHDVRVAIRRLLSTLDLLDALFPLRVVLVCRRELKEQLDLFSPLRDVQVQKNSVQEMIPSHPELNAFCDELIKQEQKVLKQARKQLAKIKTETIKSAVESLKKKLGSLSGNPSAESTMRVLVMGVANAAFMRVVRRQARVNPSNAATLHRVRVAFKRFRYMREALHPHGVKLSRVHSVAMHDFQTLLGNLQDVEVHMEYFHAFLKKHTLPEDAFYTVHLALLKKRMEMVEAFLRRENEIYTYGKPVSSWYKRELARVSEEKPGEGGI